MLMERNTLMEWVYPKIKEYCKERHGLEFQVKNVQLVPIFTARKQNEAKVVKKMIYFRWLT